jgi:hypothetical protein
MKHRRVVLTIPLPSPTTRARWVVIGVLVLGAAAVAYASDFTPFSSGEQLTSAKMNANLKALQDRIAGLEHPPAARASIAASQAVPMNTLTVLNFATSYDSASAVISEAPWTYKVPAAGKYRISASAFFTSSTAFTAGEAIGLRLQINSGASPGSLLSYSPDTSSSRKEIWLSGSDTIALMQNDQVQVFVQQSLVASGQIYSDGANGAYSGHVDILRVGN